jgi:enterochelin esterase-like enzyme/sugar lactone lactonase YvrE
VAEKLIGATTMRILFISLFLAAGFVGAESAPRHPDSLVKPAVPAGVVHEMPTWKSRVFPNTERDWSVYVPAQYQPNGAAALMIFQDGAGYANRTGAWRVPTVFDNLIASGDMPPTVAVFISPGHDPAKPRKNAWSGSNRSFEYDSLGPRYADFLLTEILPEVEKKWPVTKNPDLRAIAGASSGGICAFTVAWERPDQFRRVLSTIGSFVNLRGGNAYPSLIRKTERKPIRVFLQDSSGDLDNPFGNWPLANQMMHSSLVYMGYDVKFDYVEGYGHNSDWGSAIFPDMLRWLWRKEPWTPPVPDTKGDLGGDLTLHRLLIPGEGWQQVSVGQGYANGLTADREGQLLASDMTEGTLWRISEDGKRSKLSNDGGIGCALGPDGRAYLTQNPKRRVIAQDLATGAIEVILENCDPNDLVVTKQGMIYLTETEKNQITLVDLKTKQARAVGEVSRPNGIALSPDGGTLAVTSAPSGSIWAFRVRPDGGLDAKLPYMSLRCPIDLAGEFASAQPPPYVADAGANEIITSKDGRYFVTTTLGVQVFDPTGRECGLLPSPVSGKPVLSCALAGKDRQWLYLSVGDVLMRRRVQAVGW